MTKEQEIRNAIVDRLLDQTLAADRVYPMQREPSPTDVMPQIAIYTLETPSENQRGNVGERRASQVKVVLYEKGPHKPATEAASADFKLDAIREQVENLLNVQEDYLGVSRVVQKSYQGFRTETNKDQPQQAELRLACVLTYNFDYIYDNKGAQ